MSNGYFRAIQYDLEDLLRELSAQCLAIKRGLREEQGTGAIYAAHPVATDLDSILWLRDFSSAQVDPDLRERAARVYFACVGQFLRMDLLLRDQALAQFMVEARVQVGNQAISLAEMEGWLMTEEDFSRRETVLRGARPLFQKASLIKAKIWEAMANILREDFGYQDYLHFFQEKKGIDLGSLAGECRDFLYATEGLYRERVLPWVESRLGKPAASVNHLHMLRLMQWDGMTAASQDSGVPRLIKAVLEGLDLEAALGRRIHLDAEARQGKSSISRCVPLSVPEEIYVTLTPMGGFSDLEAALHELGHALQLAHADPALEYPYRHLPRSYGLTECFGFLMEGLAREPEFLARQAHLPESEVETLCAQRRVKQLYVIRRYAGKLLFEREFLPKGEWLNWVDYPKWMGLATGLAHEPVEALMDLGEELYAADYLRAWAAEVLLRKHLRDGFGPRWFLSREAGKFLRELWSRGERYGLEELLSFLGLEPPRMGILAEEVSQGA